MVINIPAIVMPPMVAKAKATSPNPIKALLGLAIRGAKSVLFTMWLLNLNNLI